MPTYKLGSSPAIHAPGLVAWAINAYKHPKDKSVVLRIIVETWPGFPEAEARLLLMTKRPYAIDGDTVIVATPDDPPADAEPLAHRNQGGNSR